MLSSHLLLKEAPVMSGTGDEMATGGRGLQRASDADREQVVDALKAAFVQGRLTKDEFDLRVGQVFASRTYADLDLLTADIPAGSAKIRPLEPAIRTPEPARNPNRKFIARATITVAGVGMVPSEAVGIAVHHPVVGLFVGAFVGGLAAALMAGLLTFLSWVLSKSAGERPSQGTLTGGTGTRSAAPAAGPVRRPPYTLATAAS
jgi:hypothetical protein